MQQHTRRTWMIHAESDAETPAIHTTAQPELRLAVAKHDVADERHQQEQTHAKDHDTHKRADHKHTFCSKNRKPAAYLVTIWPPANKVSRACGRPVQSLFGIPVSAGKSDSRGE